MNENYSFLDCEFCNDTKRYMVYKWINPCSMNKHSNRGLSQSDLEKRFEKKKDSNRKIKSIWVLSINK